VSQETLSPKRKAASAMGIKKKGARNPLRANPTEATAPTTMGNTVRTRGTRERIDRIRLAGDER
jgi:hypothetical protein